MYNSNKSNQKRAQHLAAESRLQTFATAHTSTTRSHWCSDESSSAPSVSPNGKWLAYISDEAGQPQLYILRRFSGGLDLPVSRDFAQGPVWARDSSELYFQGVHQGVLMMLAVRVGDTTSGPPGLSAIEPLFPLRTVSGVTRIDAYRASTNGATTFDVLPDGRFVMPRSEDQTRYRELVLIQNLDLPAREAASD